MKDFSINTNIKVGTKKLHIQTSFSEENQQAAVCIFDGGALVDKRVVQFENDITQDEAGEETRQYHELVISDIKLMFFIAGQVKSSQYQPSIEKLGRLFLEKGFYNEAIDQFNLVKKIDTEKANCDYEIGKAYFKKGEFKIAQEYLEIALKKHPNYSDIHFFLGQIYWELAEYSKAIHSLQNAIEFNKEYHQAYFTLARYLIESTLNDPKNPELSPPIERIKEAIKNINKAISLSHDFDMSLISSCIDKLNQVSKRAEALDCLNRAYKPSKSVNQSINIESEFYLKFMFSHVDGHKEIDQYIRTIEKSVSQHPNYADLHQTLGLLYLIKGWHYFIKATNEFRSAVKINPLFETAKKRLKLLENDGRGFLILLRALLK